MARQEVYQLSPYMKDEEKPDDNDKTPIYFGDLDSKKSYQNDEPTDYIEVPYTTGSDYSGDSVTVANYRAIWEDHKEMPGLYQIYGGHGTYGLVIRRDVLESDTENGETMREIIEKLNDYPLYDEEMHSEVEHEAENEAWDDWAKRDYRRELEKNGTLPEDSDLETTDGHITDDQLFRVFSQVADAISEYWENETGNSAHIDVKRIVDATTEEDVQEVLSEVVTVN